MPLPAIIIAALVVAIICISLSLFMLIILFRRNEWLCFSIERDTEGNVVQSHELDVVEIELRQMVQQQQKKMHQNQPQFPQFGCDMPIVKRFASEMPIRSGHGLTSPANLSKQLFASEMPINHHRQPVPHVAVIDVAANTLHRGIASEMPIIRRERKNSGLGIAPSPSDLARSPSGLARSPSGGNLPNDHLSPRQKQRHQSKMNDVVHATEYSGSGSHNIVSGDSHLETGSARGSAQRGGGFLNQPSQNRSHRGSATPSHHRSHKGSATPSAASRQRQLHHGHDFPIVAGGLRAQRDAAALSQAGSSRSRNGVGSTPSVPIPLSHKQRDHVAIQIYSPAPHQQHTLENSHSTLTSEPSVEHLNMGKRSTHNRKKSIMLDPSGVLDIVDPNNDILSVESRNNSALSGRKLRPSPSQTTPQMPHMHRTHARHGSHGYHPAATPAASTDGAIVAVDDAETRGPWKRVVMNQQSYWVNTETMESSWTLPIEGKSGPTNMFDKP